MVEMIAFIKGIIIGIVVSAPVGPVGIVCIQYALQRGMSYAVLAGLGAALADTLFSALACFGIDIVTEWMQAHCTLLQISGGIVITILGLQMYYYATLSPTESSCRAYSDKIAVVGSTFLITLANPLTILAFIALFTTFLECKMELDQLSTLMTILGVFLGAMLWWICLSAIAVRIGRRLSQQTLAILRKTIGIVLVAIGLVVTILH